MEHRGIRYNIMQGITPGAWKWSFEANGNAQSGNVQGSRESVIHLVQGRIDLWVKTHRQKPQPQFT
jgi:hypothetical protein